MRITAACSGKEMKTKNNKISRHGPIMTAPLLNRDPRTGDRVAFPFHERCRTWTEAGSASYCEGGWIKRNAKRSPQWRKVF